jgi:1-acyl-sn-glycerol-3-phosphate acyltransferase
VHPGAKLLVANHVSWLDILAVHAVCPEARFVSKADVRHWPLLGWLVACGGTLFIERERKRDALRVVHQIAEALRRATWWRCSPRAPRATATACCPSTPTCCRRPSPPNRRCSRWRCATADAASMVSQAASYVGDTSLAQSLWSTVTADKLVARVVVENAQGTRHADRRALAEHLREAILGRLQEDRA